MQNINIFVYAYKQAPWRMQRQWIGGFLLMVLGLAMVAALYLDVTARAALAGREIQNLSAEITAVQQSNADLETRIAVTTSTHAMEQRAAALGYQPVDSSQVQFIMVPGYSAPAPALLAAAPSAQPGAPVVPSAYTQSLLDWLDQRLHFLPTLSMTGSLQ